MFCSLSLHRSVDHCCVQQAPVVLTPVSQRSVDNACKFLQPMVSQHNVDIGALVGCCMIHNSTAVCCDPNQPVIQWEAHNRNGLLHYIVPPSFSTKDCALLRDKKHGRKVALYMPVPSILRLENGNSAFAGVFTVSDLLEDPASFDTIVEQNSLRKAFCNRIC